MKTNDAELLASSLSQEQRKALQIVKGKSSDRTVLEPEPFVVLRELGLIRVEQSEDREFVELTQRGRKVAEFL